MIYPNLKAEMARKGVTQKSLTLMLGWSCVSKLSRKLNGISPVSLDEAVAIKKVLDVDVPLEMLFEEK